MGSAFLSRWSHNAVTFTGSLAMQQQHHDHEKNKRLLDLTPVSRNTFGGIDSTTSTDGRGSAYGMDKRVGTTRALKMDSDMHQERHARAPSWIRLLFASAPASRHDRARL
jgi:hypothetical protein